MALSQALSRSAWRCPYTDTCGEWKLSFRKQCWKCSTKYHHATEVVLGTADPNPEGASSSEEEEEDRALVPKEERDGVVVGT